MSAARPASRRKTGRTSVAVVIGLVAVGSVSACGGSDDPAAVAQEWANATLNHEDKASSLQCRPDINNHGFALIKLTTISLTGFRALDSTQTSSGTWTVTLQTEPTQGATFDVTVVEQHGKYLVCS